MGRRKIYLILALVAMASGAVVFWHLWSDRDSRAEASRTATVERGSMTIAVTAAGRMEPAARVDLAFETPGRVAEIFVEEGDRVDAGDPLARLEADQLELQVTQARAALASAEAHLSQLEAGPRRAEIEQAEANLRAASAQLTVAVATRDQIARGASEAEIASARAAVEQAKAARKMAQDAYDRIDEEGTRREQANYDLYTADQELAAAEARLEDLTQGPRPDELRAARANVAAAVAQHDAAQAQLDQVRSGTTEHEIAEAAAQAEQARLGLALVQDSLEKMVLQAPFSGQVSEINLTVGEMAPTRLPPIVLMDDSAYQMAIGVDELDISRMEPGQAVEITIEALPDAAVTGTLKTIAPIATPGDGVVTYAVLVELAPTEAPLRADMTANATVVVEQLTNVLVVPTWAVRVDRETGQPFVERRVGGEIERVDVALGPRHEGVAQVLSGLTEGDEVVRLEEGSTFDFGLR